MLQIRLTECFTDPTTYTHASYRIYIYSILFIHQTAIGDYEFSALKYIHACWLLHRLIPLSMHMEPHIVRMYCTYTCALSNIHLFPSHLFLVNIYLDFPRTYTQTHTYLRARQTHIHTDTQANIRSVLYGTATLFRNRQIKQNQHLLCIKYNTSMYHEKQCESFPVAPTRIYGIQLTYLCVLYVCVIGVYVCVNSCAAENEIVFSHCDSLNKIYIMPGISAYSEFYPNYSVLNSHFSFFFLPRKF